MNSRKSCCGAYHEACSALDGAPASVCFYEDLHPVRTLPGQSLGPLIKAIQNSQGSRWRRA